MSEQLLKLITAKKYGAAKKYVAKYRGEFDAVIVIEFARIVEKLVSACNKSARGGIILLHIGRDAQYKFAVGKNPDGDFAAQFRGAHISPQIEDSTFSHIYLTGENFLDSWTAIPAINHRELMKFDTYSECCDAIAMKDDRAATIITYSYIYYYGVPKIKYAELIQLLRMAISRDLRETAIFLIKVAVRNHMRDEVILFELEYEIMSYIKQLYNGEYVIIHIDGEKYAIECDSDFPYFCDAVCNKSAHHIVFADIIDFVQKVID